MCLLSVVYHPVNWSIAQYITNDTVGVNDSLGLGRIMLPRKINQLAAVFAAVRRRQTHLRE